MNKHKVKRISVTQAEINLLVRCSLSISTIQGFLRKKRFIVDNFYVYQNWEEPHYKVFVTFKNSNKSIQIEGYSKSYLIHKVSERNADGTIKILNYTLAPSNDKTHYVDEILPKLKKLRKLEKLQSNLEDAKPSEINTLI